MPIVNNSSSAIPRLTLTVFFVVASTSCCLSQSTYDDRLVSTYKKIDFDRTEKRGVKGDDGTIYFVGKGKQVVTAYDGFRIKWTINVIIFCGSPAVGKPEIKILSLEKDHLAIVYGKHSYARIDLDNGKLTCQGSD